MIALPVNVGRLANFGECYIISPIFIGFEETSSYWSVPLFFAFHRPRWQGLTFTTPVSSPQTIGDRNSLAGSLTSAVEYPVDLVTKFNSLVRTRD